MKIVLTGPSGFIGGAFLRHMLGKGDPGLRIICLSSSDAGQEKLLAQWPELEVHALRSLNDPGPAKAIGNADAFIHCGWSTVPRTAEADPEKDLIENVYHGLSLIASATRAGMGRFIFLSSGGTVYGHGSGEPFTEECRTMPVSAYGISKLTFEHYLNAQAAKHGMRHLVLRPGNIYGRVSDPLRPQGVIEHWMHRIIHNEPLHIWGDTGVVRDYVHIDDLVMVLEAALSYDGDHSIFNVGTGTGTSLKELLEILAALAGRDLDLVQE